MKRLTKAQKEDQQRAALMQRVSDIYSGAMGAEWGPDEFATAEILSRVLPVLQEIFDPEKQHGWAFAHHCLRNFDNAHAASTHLYNEGMRA